MTRVHNQKMQTRLLIASALFSLSIFSSFLFNFLSHNKESYWILKNPIAAGSTINSSDIELRKAALDPTMTAYLSSKSSPIGLMANRNLVVGELLTRNALNQTRSTSDFVTLSVSIRAVDLPESVRPGDVVDLYAVADKRSQALSTEPSRVAERAFVLGVSRNSANFSSDVALTISIDNRFTTQVLSATADGRLVTVLSHG